MARSKPRKRTQPPTPPAFRSAAVAQMAQMPVATLRIWEQRYRAVAPARSPSGQRLYSPGDVQRVLLLRRLTEQGHAISAIAGLEGAALEQLLVSPAQGAAAAGAKARLVVVGLALAARLERAGGVSTKRVAVFESLAEAVPGCAGVSADGLIWHAPELLAQRPAEVLAQLKAAQQACGARRVMVVYRFAGAAAIKAFTDEGMMLIREPADDAMLGAVLASLESAPTPRPMAPLPPTPPMVAPRRFDDATLTSIAARASTVACECPRHVAEILMELSSFESYSAGCLHQSAADAALHGYLQQVAGAARMLFEAALERVARHEGVPLR